jgi:hypothetical protein
LGKPRRGRERSVCAPGRPRSRHQLRPPPSLTAVVQGWVVLRSLPLCWRCWCNLLPREGQSMQAFTVTKPGGIKGLEDFYAYFRILKK